MKHVKFILEMDLEETRGFIENYSAKIDRLKEDIEKIHLLQERYLEQEIELVKALALLEELK